MDGIKKWMKEREDRKEMIKEGFQCENSKRRRMEKREG